MSAHPPRPPSVAARSAAASVLGFMSGEEIEEGMSGFPSWLPEILGEGGGDIGERSSETDAVPLIAMKHDEGHALACVVRAFPGGIISVICGDDDQVFWEDAVAERFQPLIELCQSLGIAHGISAMAIERIEVDQVAED